MCSRLICGGCGTVWGSEWAAGGFVLCVWDSWGSECTAGGFMVGVGQFGGVSVQQVALWCLFVCLCVCVCVSRGNYMTAVLRTIHLFHGGLSGYL